MKIELIPETYKDMYMISNNKEDLESIKNEVRKKYYDLIGRFDIQEKINTSEYFWRNR